MKQRYLVTGGAGFVGSNLVDQLLARGHHVTVLDNLSTGSRDNLTEAAKHEDYEFVYGDITNPSDVRYVIDDDHQFDGIFHLAGMPRIQPSFSKPNHSINTNCQGTANILELARKQGARLVYAGSSSFYHDVYANPYSFSKWQGEELCKLYRAVYQLPVAIARFFNVYGPRQLDDGAYSTVIGIFERQYRNSEALTITGDGEQRRDFTHIDDIVSGLIAIDECHLRPRVFNNTNVNFEKHHTFEVYSTAYSENEPAKIFNLGTGTNYSINEVAAMFPDCETTYIPKRPGEAWTTLADISFTKSLLGWSPQRSLSDYIKNVTAH